MQSHALDLSNIYPRLSLPQQSVAGFHCVLELEEILQPDVWVAAVSSEAGEAREERGGKRLEVGSPERHGG